MNRRFTDEIVSDQMADILRAKTPAQRLKIISDLWVFARNLIYNASRQEHPDWSEEELQKYVAKRIAHDAG